MNHTLTSGRYVGAKARKGADEPFKDKMKPFVAELRLQHAEAEKLNAAIPASLKVFAYDR